MPLIDGQLAGDDGGAAPLPVFEDFQEVAPFIWDQHGEPPIIEDQQFGARDGFQDACVSTVASGDGQRLEQTGHAMIHHTAIIPAGFMPKRAGNPTLAQPGWAGDEHNETP